jgi:hypothetical protein
MPTPLASAFFIFAAFLLTVSTLAALIVAGFALLIQVLAFFYLASVSQPEERVATVPREFAWEPPGGGNG